jgi:hypothetical protein
VCMRNIHFAKVCLILTVALPARAQVICDKVRPLKPVRCVCGKLTDPTGGPVVGAAVKVVKDGKEVAATTTDEDGSFVFGELKSGSYELNAHLDGLVPFRSPIVVANPAKHCRRGLLIMLVTSYPDNCGSFVAGRKRIRLPKNSN